MLDFAGAIGAESNFYIRSDPLGTFVFCFDFLALEEELKTLL